jgi:hypothetical protein
VLEFRAPDRAAAERMVLASRVTLPDDAVLISRLEFDELQRTSSARYPAPPVRLARSLVRIPHPEVDHGCAKPSGSASAADKIQRPAERAESSMTSVSSAAAPWPATTTAPLPPAARSGEDSQAAWQLTARRREPKGQPLATPLTVKPTAGTCSSRQAARPPYRK